MMRAWYRRAAALHGELAGLAELRDPRWWLIAGGAALPWETRAAYVTSDAEPATDTFIGHVISPRDPIALARAARTAMRELDGELPDQPLAVTIRRTPSGAVAEPSSLEVAAFAIGDTCWCANLDDPALPAALSAVLRGQPHASLRAPGSGPTPFVCITLGDEPLATARHAHRRAWTAAGGPWLGITRSSELQLVTTCHLIVDGYGHARLASRINDLSGDVVPSFPCADLTRGKKGTTSPIKGAISLNVVWRPVTGQLRAIPLAYQLGIELHRLAGRPDARFSPTIQVPVAPGAPMDPVRMRRRVVPAIVSVRFDGGVAEPYAQFAARARTALAREASGAGLTSSLLAAARATPAPLAWKRRAVGPRRPRWLEPVADLIGGRGCVSRISLDVPSPAACAVSSPARLVDPDIDPIGACVLTVVDDGERSAITLAGVGNAADATTLERVLVGTQNIR
jgi:hypothetical protein